MRVEKSEPPDTSLPWVECDFNACGWTGAAGDDCYYVFDEQALLRLGPVEGARLIIFADEGGGEVFGCEGRLERFGEGWRVRPDPATWFRGQAGRQNLA